MRLAFIQAPKPVSAHGLHDSHVHVRIVVPHEHFAFERDEPGKIFEIVIEQMLTQFRRQIGFGIVQQRSDVVLQGAFAAALVVHEKWTSVTQQNVARLKIPIQKIIAAGAE